MGTDQLPLGHGHSPWVYIAALEGSKPKLAWGRCVAVAAAVQDRNAESLKDSQCGAALVVAGIVQQDHRVRPPISPLSVQLEDQLPKENLHYLAVGVGLEQGQVDMSTAVEASNH